MTNHTKPNTTFNIPVIAFAIMHVGGLAVIPAIEDLDALRVKKILKKAFGVGSGGSDGGGGKVINSTLSFTFVNSGSYISFIFIYGMTKKVLIRIVVTFI